MQVSELAIKCPFCREPILSFNPAEDLKKKKDRRMLYIIIAGIIIGITTFRACQSQQEAERLMHKAEENLNR